ncbi:hypothetical protein QE152_g33015 [Popillia japonica]|uniref:Uncharacterized protein n=1 Tax=Popillia japonica TaxID=7064 RepID=A0AAW1IYD8_POPJA
MNFFRRIQWCDRFRDATHGLEVTAPGHIMGEAVNRARPPCRPAADASIPIDGQLQNLEYLRNRWRYGFLIPSVFSWLSFSYELFPPHVKPVV